MRLLGLARHHFKNKRPILDYGVMVAQQTLVLLVGVRILVVQQRRETDMAISVEIRPFR